MKFKLIKDSIINLEELTEVKRSGNVSRIGPSLIILYKNTERTEIYFESIAARDKEFFALSDLLDKL